MKTLLLTIAAAVVITGCDDAMIANRNLTKAADNFEIQRRIVFMNGITDEYLMVIEGRCALTADTKDNQLEVLCKVGDGFKKHFLGLSDNVTYFAEQLEPKAVSVDNYRVTFKPQVIVPDVDVRGGAMSGPTIERN